MKNIIVFGANKGLGDALVKGLPEPGDNVWIVSRSRPDSLLINDGVHRSWIQADLSLLTASSEIADVLENETIDVLVYNVGIWEKEGFQDHYDFEQDDPTDIANLIQVNITSGITCIQKLLPHMKNSDNGKIFLIGSTAGLENTNHSQVSFVASKFGLRGIGNALREHVRKYSIGVMHQSGGTCSRNPLRRWSRKGNRRLQRNADPSTRYCFFGQMCSQFVQSIMRQRNSYSGNI